MGQKITKTINRTHKHLNNIKGVAVRKAPVKQQISLKVPAARNT